MAMDPSLDSSTLGCYLACPGRPTSTHHNSWYATPILCPCQAKLAAGLPHATSPPRPRAPASGGHTAAPSLPIRAPHPIPCSPHANTITEPSNRPFAEMTIKGQPAATWPSMTVTGSDHRPSMAITAGWPWAPGPGARSPTPCGLLVNVISRQHHGQQKRKALTAPPFFQSPLTRPAGLNPAFRMHAQMAT